MFIKCTTIYCLVFSFVFAGQVSIVSAQNLPFTASTSKLSTEEIKISKDDLIYMTDTLSTINDFTSPKQTGCEVQGVVATAALNEFECLTKLNKARERARACMSAYLKTKNTNRLSTSDECKKFDSKNAADVIAQQAYILEAIKNLLAQFKTSDPNKVFKNLSAADKDLFYALFDALAEKNETKTILDQMEKQKKDEANSLKKAAEINQLEALGLAISEGSNSETLKIGITPEKPLKFEKLKDINAPEYAIFENYLGKEAAQNLKNMYVDPPLKKRGGTKSVAIGDMVIIPNFGTSNNSKPEIISNKDYNKIQEDLFQKFAEKNIQCIELSQKANTKTNAIKEFIRKDDSLTNQKDTCLNDMARIHHSMSAKLGIEKPIIDKISAMLKLAIEKDINNYKKNINLSELIDKTKAGLKTFTEITVPKNLFAVKYGKVVIKDIAKKGPNLKAKFVETTAAIKNIDSQASNSCNALEYGEELISSDIGNLVALSKKDAISMILPFLADDLKETSSNLKKLTMLEEYPTTKDFLDIKDKSQESIGRLSDIFKKINSMNDQATAKSEDLKLEAAKKAQENKTNTSSPALSETKPETKPVLSTDKADSSEKKSDTSVTLAVKMPDSAPILTTPETKTTPVEPAKTGAEDKKDDTPKVDPAKEEADKALEKELALKKKIEEGKKACDEKIKKDVDAEGKLRGNFEWKPEINKCIDLIQIEKDKTACTEAAKKDIGLAWNDKSLQCENPEKICEQKQKDAPSENWKWEKDKKTCASSLTPEHQACNEKIKADTNSALSWNSKNSKCEDKNVIDKEKKACDVLSASDTTMRWNAEINVCENIKKLCEDKPKTTESSSVWNETTNACDVIKLSKKEQCDQKNLDKDGKPVMDEESGSRVIRFEWNFNKESCVDLKANKSDSDEDEDDEDDSLTPFVDSNPKRAPGRFRPVQIPSRQPYMMPGMP